MLKYKYIFQIKYTEAVLSNSARQLLWFEKYQNADCSLRKKFIVLFILIFGTLSFPVPTFSSQPQSFPPGLGG